MTRVRISRVSGQWDHKGDQSSKCGEWPPSLG
ncbi:unnamed protein product [Penicillium camemberti]|uniref:Str. FM013 n=1 Tax=Penicillium camemberti (strain FM 013) TaxID=1429867 RepID=A0A0G4PYM2_PENC3|nr:unnamed protein product [Penicillium camemberti]